ncbi:hypothetical protein C1I91_06695 [Clostridium manihotivorum]|uniref:Uncharacterized protein n=1 Tax=Clostridium manihotivorum TaxID=2320868 RepID=A0A3R5TE71_9CLOT|nr:hypothetical protein C1I91_06695 [Clostridium manihotivorum]
MISICLVSTLIIISISKDALYKYVPLQSDSYFQDSSGFREENLKIDRSIKLPLIIKMIVVFFKIIELEYL